MIKTNDQIKLTYVNKKDPFVIIDGIKFKRAADKKLEAIKSNPIILIENKE